MTASTPDSNCKIRKLEQHSSFYLLDLFYRDFFEKKIWIRTQKGHSSHSIYRETKLADHWVINAMNVIALRQPCRTSADQKLLINAKKTRNASPNSKLHVQVSFEKSPFLFLILSSRNKLSFYDDVFKKKKTSYLVALESRGLYTCTSINRIKSSRLSRAVPECCRPGVTSLASNLWKCHDVIF